MCPFCRNPVVFCQIRQPVMLQIRKLPSRHLQCINIIIWQRPFKILFHITIKKIHVKSGNVMSNQHESFNKLQKFFQNLFKKRCFRNHIIRNAIYTAGSVRNPSFRIHQRTELIRNLAVLHLHCRNLNHFVRLRRNPGRLQIKDHIIRNISV